MKKLRAFILSLLVITLPIISTNPFISTTVSAEIAHDFLNSIDYTSNLTISNRKANCHSIGIGYDGETTKIIMDQTLQKKTSSGSWSKVAAWSSTVRGYKAEVRKFKDNLSAGTYRLKTVFTVYSGNKSETVTRYSSTKTVK